jgi:hypothetical protein
LTAVPGATVKRIEPTNGNGTVKAGQPEAAPVAGD